MIYFLIVDEDDVRAAVLSFPSGSGAGMDGLKPQHLKDCLADRTMDSGLLTALTAFVNGLLRGDCPQEIHPLLFGGALTALSKKDGGIRPIAVGSGDVCL